MKDYVEIGIGQKAVENNYDVKNGNTARAIASENLTKPNIIEAIEVKQQSLKSALIEKGITPTYLAEKVDVLLKATDEKGRTDYTAVDKGLKHATNIYGVENIEDKPKGQNTYNFIFNTETQSEIKEIEDRIKARLIQKHESN